jgi:uncharacterized membrane protein YfcA
MRKKRETKNSSEHIKHRARALIVVGAIGLLMTAISSSIGITGFAISNQSPNTIYSLSVGMLLVSLIAMYIGSKYSN